MAEQPSSIVSDRRRRPIEVGATFGRLTVIREAKRIRTAGGRSLRTALVRCACGNLKMLPLTQLRAGTISCGCVRRERLTTHGMFATRTYSSWQAMKRRCKDAGPLFPTYRAAGIMVCDRWRHSFENFLDDMGERPPGLSLDRIDNDGNYEPGNCRWATRGEQSRNRRNIVWIFYDGSRMCLKDACEAAGVTKNTVTQKVRVNRLAHQEAFERLAARAKARG